MPTLRTTLRSDSSLGESPGRPPELKISVIVVAFGKEDLLETCLRSVDTALRVVGSEVEVIVVLNQISTSCREKLECSASSHVLLDNQRNLGFAGGVAVGLARARGQWVALINDDCVLEPEALAEMLDAGTVESDIGAVAAQIRFAGAREIINSAGIEVDELGIAYERLLGEPASAARVRAGDIFGASGAAALYRRAMLDEVGGFDESFFAYLEDADVAWRARMHGWRAVYAPDAVVRHRHSTTLGHRSTRKYYLVGRNRVRMLAKNATRSQLLRHGLAMVAYDLAYVSFVAVRESTLAPLRGRLRGLREWRLYRAAGASHRRRVPLAPRRGIRGALRRDRAYGMSSCVGSSELY